MKRHAIFGIASAVIVTVLACSNTTGPGPNGKGLCVGSCPKTCSADADCTTQSPLCCDFGKYGKACTTPQQCAPARFCTDDTKCNTAQGETCCAANTRELGQKVCVQANTCKKTCGTDNDCAGTTQPKCCGLYATPICTTAQACPNTCAASAECNTAANETCCTGVKELPQFKGVIAGSVAGICIPAGTGNFCPKTCAQSTDCDTANGQLCCNGFCSNSCPKECDDNQQCDTARGQFCCNSQSLASPWYGFTASAPPPPCGQVGRCTHNFECTGGQICCVGMTGPDGGSQCGQQCVGNCRTGTCNVGTVACP